MADLRIGFVELRAAAARLEEVRELLLVGQPALWPAADSVGHPALAVRLRGVAEEWDVAWERWRSRSEALAAACRQIAATFELAERRLAGAPESLPAADGGEPDAVEAAGSMERSGDARRRP